MTRTASSCATSSRTSSAATASYGRTTSPATAASTSATRNSTVPSGQAHAHPTSQTGFAWTPHISARLGSVEQARPSRKSSGIARFSLRPFPHPSVLARRRPLPPYRPTLRFAGIPTNFRYR
ncbi:unnamed protein product, partial [Ectocarpus sp. 6 AP-2014]